MKKTVVFLLLSFFMSASLLAQYKTYRIKKGQTLEELAHKFGVKKSAILKLNPDLKNGKIKRKTIVVPSRETDTTTPKATRVRFKSYRVQKKETLYSIAKRNDISVADIKKYNPYLYKNPLGVNEVIKIPIFQDGKEEFNASVQTSTFKNLIHVVLPKETKYGISHQYGMTVAELDSLNPLIGELHPGQVLKVINPLAQKEPETQFGYYEVKPKETLYSLTKRLGISVDSLKKLNPILKELGLQAGMELKIPKEGAGSFSGLKMASSQRIDLSRKLSNFSTKDVVVMLPFNLQNFDGATDKKSLLKKDKIASLSLALYSGIEIAVDSVKSLGISVNLQVFDTRTNRAKVDEIVNQNNFKHTQFIIGPLLSSNIQEVAKKLKGEEIPIFSPLTNSKLGGSNQIVQTRPSHLVKEKTLLSYLILLKKDSVWGGHPNIMIIADKKHDLFAEKIKAHFSSAHRVKMERDYLQKSDLTTLLREDRPNWVIVETDDYGAVSNAMSYLNALRHQYKIRVFTSDKNSIYDKEVTAIYLSHLHFTYTGIDRNDVQGKDNSFVDTYKKKYGITPSQYAIRGFDVTFDALLRSASAKNVFKALEQEDGTTEYVGNRFDYHKKLIGGYYNSAVYLIKFDKNLNLKVLN